MTILFCAGLALLLLPHAAAAKPGFFVSKPHHLETLRLKGSNGYSVELLSLDSRRLFLSAHRFDRSARSAVQSATYVIPRHESRPSEIHASVGELGEISLKFHPAGPPEPQTEPGSECKGRSSTQQQGQFAGSFRFRGELGFTAVQTTGAAGEIYRSYRQVCKRPKEGKGSARPPEAVSLGAYTSGHPDRPSFSAFKFSRSRFRSDDANFSANVTEHLGEITITRSAYVIAEPSTFVVSEPTASPINAAVSPPFPFAGTATFERAPNSQPTWSGDLSADLPGLGTVPLTGPSFSSKLCRSTACVCPPGRPCVIVSSG